MLQLAPSAPRTGAACTRRRCRQGITRGPLTSGASAAASAIYEETGIVSVTPGATWAPLTPTIRPATPGSGKRLREIVGAEAEGWLALYGDVLRTGRPIRRLTTLTMH